MSGAFPMVPPLMFSEDFRDGSILEGIRFVNPFSPEFLLEKWSNLFFGFSGRSERIHAGRAWKT
jgi:hypothetical protein